MSVPDYSKLAAERFTGTKIDDYDQITAVTQRAINFQLRLMHTVAKSKDPKSPICHLLSDTFEDDQWTQINAELGPPSIELRIGTESQTVIYTMNLESGVFQYYKGRGKTAKEVSTPINKWRLAFRVNMNWAVILDENKVPGHVQEALKNPLDYSVHQLLVDFTTADVSAYIADKSFLGLQDDYAKAQFKLYIDEYLKKLMNDPTGQHSTIHYLPTIKNPENYRLPTLAPTSLNFQNLPFVIDTRDQGTGNSDDNMLIYLQMTKNRSLPRKLLSASANWVVPPVSADRPRYDGTVCMSKTSFLDGWLLPQLAKFNRESSWVVTDAYWRQDGLHTAHNLDGHCGFNSDEETNKGSWVADDASTNSSVRAYTYDYHSRKDDDKGVWRVYQNATTQNKLEIPTGLDADGKCVIKLSGETKVECYVRIDLFSSYSTHVGTWNASLTFDGINKGYLKIKAAVTVNPVKENIDEGWFQKGDIGFFKDRIKDSLKNLSMTDVVNDLENVLGGSWKFLFSGGDDFFIDRVAFNSEGDLMAELKYKSSLSR